MPNSAKNVGKDSYAINNTLLRRLSTLIAVEYIHRFRRKTSRDSSIRYLSDKLCVKVGTHVVLAEAHAIRFVAQRTSIPVPRIHCAFTRKGVTYIVQHRLPGRKLAYGWLERTDESRAKILAQLHKMVEQLQAIPIPEECTISDVLGGPIIAYSVAGSEKCGPFANVKAFHGHLMSGIQYQPDNHPKVNKVIEIHKKDWPLCFPHGDLSSLNILVQRDQVTGIIDWECAAWLPKYWEYTTACNVNPWNLFWRDYIDSFIDPIPDALEMETLRLRVNGPLGCTLDDLDDYYKR